MSASIHVSFNTDMFCVVELPIDHRLSVFNHELTRQWGFHPRVPQALRDRDETSSHSAV